MPRFKKKGINEKTLLTVAYFCVCFKIITIGVLSMRSGLLTCWLVFLCSLLACFDWCVVCCSCILCILRLCLDKIKAMSTGDVLKHEVSKSHYVTMWQTEKEKTPDSSCWWINLMNTNWTWGYIDVTVDRISWYILSWLWPSISVAFLAVDKNNNDDSVLWS